MSIFRPISVISIIPFLYFLPNVAVAQNNSNLSADAMPSATLDEIIITARGIEENKLETPFVVDTVSAEDIEDKKLATVEEVLRQNPSVDIHNGGNVAYSFLWMRGTGSLAYTSLDDNSVDFRIDGVSNGKTGLARNLVDVDSITIAKGPQGTLLGSKAEAGSVIVKTTDPQDYFEGKVSGTVGSHNLKGAEAILNVPLSDNVAVRVAGITDKKDNQLIKVEDGEPLNEQERQGVQAKIRWHDDADTQDVVLGVYYDKQTNNVPLLQEEFDTLEVATFNLPHESENIAKGATLAVKRDVDFADLTYQLGYHNYYGDINRPSLPPEVLPLQYRLLGLPPAFQAPINALLSSEKNNRQFLVDESKQVSQELRLASKPDSDVKWVTGLHYEQKQRDWHNDGKLSLNDMPEGAIKAYLTTTASNGDSRKSFDNTSKAIFGELTYPVTNRLDVIAGARVTNEKLEHGTSWEGNTNNVLATAIKSDSKTLEETATTGRVGFSYAVNPNWRVYALQSRGHKFGGFTDYESNTVYGNPLSYYKPTTIDATEVGTKYQSADNRLELGLALYQNEMEDDHITVIGTPPQYLSETANVDSRSRGAELTAAWFVTDNLQINADLAYTDAKVTDASDVPDSQIPGRPKLTEEGNKMPQVPDLSGSLGVSYINDLSLLPNGQWYANANYRYVGPRFAQSFNVMELDEYHLLNASVGVMNDDHELSIWGKNLTDEKYLYIGVQPGSVGSVGPERSYGIKYSYYF